MTTAAGDGSSLRLSLDMNGCLVVASHAFNDHDKHAGAVARRPLTPRFSGPTGSSAGGSGHALVESRGEVVVGFSGSLNRQATVAVAFAPRR